MIRDCQAQFAPFIYLKPSVDIHHVIAAMPAPRVLPDPTPITPTIKVCLAKTSFFCQAYSSSKFRSNIKELPPPLLEQCPEKSDRQTGNLKAFWIISSS